jgi:hypothetical protein
MGRRQAFAYGGARHAFRAGGSLRAIGLRGRRSALRDQNLDLAAYLLEHLREPLRGLQRHTTLDHTW